MTAMTSPITRISKLNEIKKSKGIDGFLFGSASSVKYFSGYFFYFEYGISPFHLLPAVLMIDPCMDAVLILADNEMGQSPYIDPLIEKIPYESYTYETAPDPANECLKKIREWIDKNKLGSSRIGVEPGSIPFLIAQNLSELYPLMKWVDVSADVAHLKSIKDGDEIDHIRRAAALADIGQKAVMKYAVTGMTELELFALAHRDIEASAGFRIPLMSDLSSGTNTNSGGGMPTNKVIESGDLVLSDFQPCLQGYWGDSCNTLVVGAATAAQKKIFNLVKEALEMGMQAIRPGIRASEIDRLMRKHIGDYPHHSGHSVGTAYHEGPRITPYNETKLEPGMIIALEPAIYKEDYGIRLEHLMLVTNTGSEQLTQFKHRFEQ
jgi:Xaa-Pro aminopeptidase